MEALTWKASSGGLGTCGTESAKSVKPAEFLQDRSAQPSIRFVKRPSINKLKLDVPVRRSTLGGRLHTIVFLRAFDGVKR
jgi:hypothetical protein